MRYRALTADGDFTFGVVPPSAEYLINSPACVRQAIQTALLLWQGEWFLDLTKGMPWSTQVLGYGTQSLYDTAIKTCILGVEGVQSIVSYSSSLDKATRKLTVNANVQTIYGPALISSFYIPLSPGGYGIGAFGEIPFGGR